MEYKDSNIGKSRTEDKESLRRTQSDMTDQNSDTYQTATDEEEAADDEGEQVHEMTNSSSFEYPSRTSGTNNMKDFLTYRGSSNSSVLSSPPNSGDIEGLDDTDMSRERFFSSGAERSETEVMSKPSARQIVIKGRKVEEKTTSLSRQQSGVDRAEMTIEPTKRKVISITHKQTSVTTSSSSASVTPEFLEESRKRAAAAFNGPKARIVNIPIQNVKSSQVVSVKSQVVEAKVRDFFESIKATLIDPERDLMKSFMNESNIEDLSMFPRKHDVLSLVKESNATLQHSMQPAATAEMKLVPEDDNEPVPDYNSSSSGEEEECVEVEQKECCAERRCSAEKTLMSIPVNAELDRMEEENQSEVSVGRSQTFPSSPLVRKASLRQTRRRRNDSSSPANIRSPPADVASSPADVRTDLAPSESVSMKDLSAAMDNSLGHLRSNVKSLASKSVKKLEKPVRYHQSIDSCAPVTAARGKDMRRSKTNPKSNMETLKRIGKYQTMDRPSPDVKISDAQIEYLQQNYDKHEVVLRKEEGGFGLTLNGNGPVSVNYVKPDGIAFKNKVCVGDIIFKINGDLVVKKSHAEVVALVQKAGKDIALTLLRNQTNEPQQLAPIFKGEEMDVVSKPMVVAKEKDLELKESTVQTIRSMYESAVQELDALKADYQRNQSEDLSQKIENKLKVVSRLEAKLSHLTGVPIQPNSSASFRRVVQPGALVTERRRQNSKDNPAEQQTLSPPVPDLGRGMISPMIAEQPPKPVKPDIISLDMSDEDEKCPEFREFADIHTLKNNPAHLAVFLKYLILNHSPAPLLFTLITEYYSQSNAKEISNTTRWAYEIYNTFLIDKAPLQLKMIPPAMVKSIESVLKVAKENELRTIFQPPNNFIQKDLLDLLEEFRQKRSIGMGGMFGDHYLRDKMDRAMELWIVDKVLWDHFSEFVKDADNTKQAIAFGLMTIFRQIGFVNGQNSAVMENCPSFVCKDKKALKNRLKKQVIHGHPVTPFQFPASTPVICQQCRQTIWGIGCQGYRCSNCEAALHRLCLEKFMDLCSGSMRKKDPVRMMRDIIPGLKNSREEPGSKFYGQQQHGHGFVEALDLRYTTPAGNEDRESEQRSLSDDERPVSTKTTNHTRSSSMNISGMNLPLRVAPEPLDSDFEVESELPPLVTVISEKDLHKMKPKERKRQEIINELFYTERSHVRTLKVMDRVFVQRMKADPQFKDYVDLFFPNLDRIIKIHRELNNDFKARKKQQAVVTRVGDILMKHFLKTSDIVYVLGMTLNSSIVSWFSGDNGDMLKNQCAHFCKDQSFALEYLRQAQRKDPYLAQFIQNAALDPLCKKQELKDFVPKIMVRLTKYPLLVDSLVKCTPPDTEEIKSLQDVLPLMKGVLHFVNQIVKECENYRRAQSMQKRLDHKPIENSKNPVLIEHKNLDMTKHTIIYDGDLTWVLNDSKSVDLHVVLFTDLFVILHKQDNRLVLRCINTSIEDTKYQHVPIIRLTGLMIRDIPRDNRAFHLINASKEDSQIYKMVAKSKEERDNWCKYIREAVENFKNQYSSQQSQTSQTSRSTLSNLSTTSNDQPDSAGSVDSSYDALDNSTLAPIDLVLESMECTESGEKLIHPSEVVFNEVEERTSFHDLPAGPEYELKKRVLAIQTQMAEKMKALCDIHHTTISCDNRPTSLKLSMDCQQFMETAIAMVVYMTQFFSELPEELSDPEGSVAEAEYIDSLLALGEELKKLVQQLEEMIRVKEDAEKSDVPSNLLKVPGSPEQPRFIRPTSYTAALSSSDLSLDETDSSDKSPDKNT